MKFQDINNSASTVKKSVEVLTEWSQASSSNPQSQSDMEPLHPVINGGGFREHSIEECELGRSGNIEFLPFEEFTDFISLKDFDRIPNRFKGKVVLLITRSVTLLQ